MSFRSLIEAFSELPQEEMDALVDRAHLPKVSRTGPPCPACGDDQPVPDNWVGSIHLSLELIKEVERNLSHINRGDTETLGVVKSALLDVLSILENARP
jgi:hypothetical protein